jgi:hypothetical protein
MMPGDGMDGEDGKAEEPSSAPGAPVYVGMKACTKQPAATLRFCWPSRLAFPQLFHPCSTSTLPFLLKKENLFLPMLTPSHP